ncbi:MAG: aquaporin [Bacilli bacterium]|nr:aquaporin [Bacilli bacterium]MBQ6282866.1 aquaporin [Bacilli bacterium]
MRKYIAEAVGTMLLTLVACGVAVTSGVNLVATSLAFGLVIVAAAYSIGNVSGCHINPAVSISLLVAGKMNAKECICYIVAQIIGAFAGSLLLALLLGGFNALGANGLVGNTTVWVALVVEIILTFIFTTTILGVTDKKENGHVTGIVIGLTLTLVHLFGLPFTGTSVNPARSLAPAILQGGDALCNVWIFIIAPIIGAIIAGLFYKYVLKEK